MPYDLLLKELLRTFFASFIERFFPDAAADLDLTRITFLEQEIATDVGQGSSRELDLVAQVATRSGDSELILVHVELQARPAPDFPKRMFDYYTLLRRRHDLPVLPIVMYVTGGRGKKGWEQYREWVLGRLIVQFHFRRLRLRSLRAIDAVKSGDPLECALAALMDRRGADLAVLKADSLQQIGVSVVDEARRWLLANFVESYLSLTAAEEQRYQQLLADEEHQMAQHLNYHTWQREQQEMGEIRGKRDAVLRILRARFQTVSEDLTRRIESVEALPKLDALLDRAVTAANLDEVRATLPD